MNYHKPLAGIRDTAAQENNLSRTIINLLGRKRTGKETAFKLIYSHLNGPVEFQFATPLKKFCIEVLGLRWEHCYGSDAERESPTKYTWSWVSSEIREKYKKHPTDVMTARQVLQIVGTDLLRDQFYRDVWAEAGIRAAVDSRAATCVLTDGRFANEVDASRRVHEMDPSFNKVIAIRLYRLTGLTDAHESEVALDAKDAEPYQRELHSRHHAKLLDMGYRQVTLQLWERADPHAYFDYLLDNNNNVEVLKTNLFYILGQEKIMQEPKIIPILDVGWPY